MLKLLIDADMFVFISCSACEREIDWGNDVWTLHVDFEEAKATFIDKLNYAIVSTLEKMKYSGDFEVCGGYIASLPQGFPIRAV